MNEISRKELASESAKLPLPELSRRELFQLAANWAAAQRNTLIASWLIGETTSQEVKQAWRREITAERESLREAQWLTARRAIWDQQRGKFIVWEP